MVTPPDLAAPVHAEPAAEQAGPSRRTYDRVRALLPLSAVLVTASVLRVWGLGAVGFNSDETVYAGQAASIAGDPATSALFPVFRAHPLLFQTFLSVIYRVGGGDVAARLLVAVLGVATVAVVYRLGLLLYGHRVGLVAALLLAVMPYHVGVSRQVLLDTPMTFVATAALYAFARFVLGRADRWLVITGMLLGFTVLTKETAVLLVGGLVVFAILFPGVRPGVRQGLVALAVAGGVVLALPISLLIAGRFGTGQSYLAWQLFRRSNHTLLFYAEVVPPAIGFGVIAAALAGLWFLRRHGGWREGLLLCWVAVPIAFYEVWPVKGYQYLLVVAPVAAVLAARALLFLPVPWAMTRDRRRLRGTARAATIGAIVLSLAVPSWWLVDPQPTATFLAGSGGLPAGREMGHWIDANVPQGARVMTIGPSTANIVRFYGHRPAVGLSVSPNPLSRNPSYEPIENPDRELRQATIQYVVWDAFTAARSPFFSDRLLRYVNKYHGTALHTETIRLRSADGAEIDKPVMIVYRVRP